MGSRLFFVTIVVGFSLQGVAPTIASQALASGDRQSFLGVWDLVSATDYRPDGTALAWMGTAPTGNIIYTKDGRMAVQFMRDPRAKVSRTTMWTPDGRDLLPSTSAGEIR